MLPVRKAFCSNWPLKIIIMKNDNRPVSKEHQRWLQIRLRQPVRLNTALTACLNLIWNLAIGPLYPSFFSSSRADWWKNCSLWCTSLKFGTDTQVTLLENRPCHAQIQDGGQLISIIGYTSVLTSYSSSPFGWDNVGFRITFEVFSTSLPKMVKFGWKRAPQSACQ